MTDQPVARGIAASVAAVQDADGTILGTAFFVGPGVAVTAAHVVRDVENVADLRLRTSGSPSDVDEGVAAMDRDDELDLALLAVDENPERAWLPISTTWANGDDVFSHGFPEDRDESRYVDGFPDEPRKISGSASVAVRGQPLHVLVLSGDKASRGQSGSPVVNAAGHVVAVLILRIASDGKPLAIPAATLLTRWPALPDAGVADAPPTPAPAFDELSSARTGGSVQDVGWPEFDPRHLHVVGVESEGGRGKTPNALNAIISEALNEGRADIWEAFTNFWRRRELAVSGDRPLEHVDDANIGVTAVFNVVDAFSTRASLDTAVRLVVEADLAIFDVTDFEPGIMLLLGVRAAAKRGLTIVSIGSPWHNGEARPWMEGQPVARPFNLADLSLASHTPIDQGLQEDPVGPHVRRMIRRIATGFDQLRSQPRYRDAPAYDALRDLGMDAEDPASEAGSTAGYRSRSQRGSSTIPLEERVLVLCSYGKHFDAIWKHLQSQIREGLRPEGSIPIMRLQDLANPQIVSQSLYEQIRRCAACVGDWTFESPSTFFEIGVRLAVNPRALVQTVDREWIAPRGGPDDADVTGEPRPSGLEQLRRMRSLFDPLVYDGVRDVTIGDRVAEQLIALRPLGDGHHIRMSVRDAVARTEEKRRPVYADLMSAAESLHSERQTQESTPQALFYDVEALRKDQEQAALSRLIGAWLYLDQREHAGQLDEEDERHETWKELGKRLIGLLYTDDDFEFAEYIEERMNGNQR